MDHIPKRASISTHRRCLSHNVTISPWCYQFSFGACCQLSITTHVAQIIATHDVPIRAAIVAPPTRSFQAAQPAVAAQVHKDRPSCFSR
jgi:hypothetical protein